MTKAGVAGGGGDPPPAAADESAPLVPPHSSSSAAAAAAVADALSGAPLVKAAYDDPDGSAEAEYVRNASRWSLLVFGWFHPLLELGNSRGKLDPEDVAALPLPPDCVTDRVANDFDRGWEEEGDRARRRLLAAAAKGDVAEEAERGEDDAFGPSLVRVLALAFGRDFLFAGLLKLVHDVAIFVGPQVLNGLIKYMADADAPLGRGLSLTAAVTLSQLIMSLTLRHYFFRCYLTGLRVRTAVVRAVYRKALVLAGHERQLRTTGEIVNLISVDAQRMQDLTTYLHAVWYSFLQIGLALYFLWGQLGVSCLGGVVVIAIMVPVTKAVAKWLAAIQRELMEAKDRRVELNNEVLGSMKVVKLQAWEESFRDRISGLRNFELERLLVYKLVSALSVMLWSAVPLLVALATFATYVFLGNDLDVASALTALALFDILRFPLFMLPQIINRIVEASVSFGRVRSFLLCEEHRPVGSGHLTEPGIEIAGDATFLYDGKKPRWDPDGGAAEGGGKKRRRKRRAKGPVLALRKELHDAHWETTLLKSRLADAEARIRELLDRKRGDYGATTIAAAGAADDGAERESAEPVPDEDGPPADLLSLKRVNFSCRRGELIAVVGGVGSGKSTFLNALLGEVRPLSGRLAVRGRLAYFPQTPFVMNDTLKSNVLFGRDDDDGGAVDEERYRRAISACALEHDLKLLPDGDRTEIGEKGITLSGGQKARVAMARAVYRDADVYLLDDPLSAVDAHVGKHMFQSCIVEELLLGGKRNKGADAETAEKKKSTVILVTNALQYLSSPLVDRIVVLRDGAVAEEGTYAELSGDRTSLFSSFLSVMAETGGGGGSHGDASTTELEGDSTLAEDEDVDTPSEGGMSRPESVVNLSALGDVDEPEVSRILMPAKEPKDRGEAAAGTREDTDENGDAAAAAAAADCPGSPSRSRRRSRSSPSAKKRRRSSRFKKKGPPGSPLPPSSSATPLMTDEFKEREVGHVGMDVYLAWARAAGGAKVFFAIVAAFAGTEGINVLSKWWLTHWSQHGGEGTDSQFRFLAVYAVINLSAVLAVFGRLILVMFTGLAASREMFQHLLEVVLEAPMSFFDTTPIGRIINRFSKDIYTIDEQLVATLRSYLATLTSVIGVVVVVSTITPYFMLCLVPMIAFYLHQQNYFTTTYRELKRLDSVSRSPIYALLGETLDGVSTIRAFEAQPSLLRRISSMLDLQQNAYYLTCAAQCWLAVRLELVGTLVVAFACLCAVIEHGPRGGDAAFAGLAGLSVSFALSVTQSLNWSVRMGSDLEANMVAVERVEQYCRIPGEAARVGAADGDVDPKWPPRGQVRFRDVRMRYRPGLPLVLRGLDLDIPARSKVGIVGRTGAGKSTLMVALLRIVELDSGTITIDDVDIRTLGLKKLRKQIAVIPQDPVLFSGSVRTNLDPFDEYTDERLYEVLARVGLYGAGIRRVDSALSASSAGSGRSGGAMTKAASCVKSISDRVFEGGSNFSVGQRQLLVIARALLCGARIVIMDEATASVDADTDARIQRVMRTEFRDATTLTVAHRINTIMDSDYILVMDDGRAAEFDTPGALMQIGGLFKDLVDAWEKEHEQDKGD